MISKIVFAHVSASLCIRFFTKQVQLCEVISPTPSMVRRWYSFGCMPHGTAAGMHLVMDTCSC